MQPFPGDVPKVELSEEEKSTGLDAYVGDVPRNGPFPRHPYLPLTEAEANATDGGTCPSWAWDNAEAIGTKRPAFRAFAPPHPLPPVYRTGSYRAPPELADRGRRLLHMFSIVLCGGIAVKLVLFTDWDTPRNGGNHAFTGIQRAFRARMTAMNRPPSAVKHEQTR
jgi:hypothetical protein